LLLLALLTAAIGSSGCAMHADRHPADQARADGAPPLPVQRFDASDPLQREAAADPLAFLEESHAFVRASIRDYRCTFVIRERLEGRLTGEQTMEVAFRAQPFSVAVRWLEGGLLADTVVYVAGRDFDDDGEPTARVRPIGLFSWLVSEVSTPIHGDRMREATRKTIDHFGFERALDVIVTDARRGVDHPSNDLVLLGSANISSRPCLVFDQRIPPPQGADTGSLHAARGARTRSDLPTRSPTRRRFIYLDREWRVPLCSFDYGDAAGTVLLGRYAAQDVHYNVGLTDADFDLSK
jgi:hypothetical protein